ncbi:hypothetical protein [Crocinitomix algicola]|uniref:hypothetical protein n=1 Tax=Crocinitomix algicola TaxID=1740263 RepID=UPI000832E092|nr:hypothetical protein [Crocinitomix algicola]
MIKLFFLSCIAIVGLNAQTQDLLLECGQNSGQNFNGWYFLNHQVFDDIEFDNIQTACYSINGGDYGMTITKEVPAMKNYKRFNLLFNFDVINHAEINDVTYYTSIDGKNWNPISSSGNNKVVSIINDDLSIRFIRATANARFEKDGKIACNYVKVEGERTAKNLTILPTEQLAETPEYLIFNYAHQLNIETTKDELYEVMITAIKGQIIYREQYSGSNRIELPADLSGFYIVTIIADQQFKASKRIVL